MIEAHKLLRVVLSGPTTLEPSKRLVPVPCSLELMFDPRFEPQYRSEMRSTSVIGHDVSELLNRFTPSTRSRSTITCPAAAVAVSRDRWSASSAVGRDARVQLQALVPARGVVVTRSSAAMARVSQRCCTIEMTP